MLVELMLAFVMGVALDQAYTRYIHPKVAKKLSYKKRGRKARATAAVKRVQKAIDGDAKPRQTKTKAADSMSVVNEAVNKPNSATHGEPGTY